MNEWIRRQIDQIDEYVALKTIGDSKSSKDFLNEVTNLRLRLLYFIINMILIIQLSPFD